MHTLTASLLLTSLLLTGHGCASFDPQELSSCSTYVSRGPRDVAPDRSERFLGKVRADKARALGSTGEITGLPVTRTQRCRASARSSEISAGTDGGSEARCWTSSSSEWK